MSMAWSPPELHTQHELQQSCTAPGLRAARGETSSVCASMCCLSCPAASHNLVPPAGQQVMINPSKMLKMCQDFSWRTAIQSQHAPQHQRLQRGASETQHHTLLPINSLCYALGAAQAPVAPLRREEQRQQEPRMVEQTEKGQ